MIINKLQLITNYVDVDFIVGFWCSLTYRLPFAICSIYNVILKLQKNDKKRRIYACYIYHNNDSRKKIKLNKTI
jgi:hypothetical protein